jgi:hypothetical protein
MRFELCTPDLDNQNALGAFIIQVQLIETPLSTKLIRTT